MAEYIEREAVLALAKDICVLTKWDSEYHHRSIDPIDVRELPSSDVRPVVRGKWKAYNNTYICSACGRPISFWQSNFCPNCGAMMEES